VSTHLKAKGSLIGSSLAVGALTAHRRGQLAKRIERYSRLVARLKVVLPASALALLLLIAAWPRIQSAVERIKLHAPHLDLSEARNLRMVNLRYAGVDRHDRPFTVTSDVARQRPNAEDTVELESPKADMTTQSGTWIAVTAENGVYKPQAQLLDLAGNVELFQDKGNEFVTDKAHVDMGRGTAEGNDPVEGHGPFGTVTSDGFRIGEHGDVIIFTGKTHLVLDPHDSKTAKEQP